MQSLGHGYEIAELAQIEIESADCWFGGFGWVDARTLSITPKEALDVKDVGNHTQVSEF
jgi:hypothetical protein